jgi:hypothetical protein
MHRNYAAILVCATASLGIGFGQDIPTDTFNALAGEWKKPATTLYCLTALRLYATYTARGSSLPLGPAEAATAALNELLKGIPANEDLYTVAQKQPDFVDTLAKANTLKTPQAQEDTLFGKVAPLIDKIYISRPRGKQNLAAVQESSAEKNSLLAIFQLLNAYPPNNPIDQPYADDLETFRACYKMKAARLFKLVGDKILPAKK